MSEFDTISTETWKVRLPSNWSERERSNGTSIYFESADGTKGAYFSTWRFDDDSRSPIEILESIRRAEVESFAKMKDRTWREIDGWTTADPELTVLGIDYYDHQHSYRIACKLLASLPWVVRSSFHDYDCSNYDASKEFFRSLIESVTIHRDIC